LKRKWKDFFIKKTKKRKRARIKQILLEEKNRDEKNNKNKKENRKN
jgi:hypothetical protein